MMICENNHEEVCYDTQYCPACMKIDGLKADIEELEKKIEDLTEERDSFEREVEEARRRE